MSGWGRKLRKWTGNQEHKKKCLHFTFDFIKAQMRRKQTSNKRFMKIDFDSVMVILQIVIIIWWNVNFDCFHGVPGRHCYFPGAGVNVSVKTHLKGQFSFISQLRFCCTCGCRDVWTLVWSHTPVEVTEPGLSRLCSLPTVTLPVVTGGFSHWSNTSVTQGLVYWKRSLRFLASRGHCAFPHWETFCKECPRKPEGQYVRVRVCSYFALLFFKIHSVAALHQWAEYSNFLSVLSRLGTHIKQ